MQKQTTLLQVKNIFTFFILSFGFSWTLHAQDPLIPRFETDVAPILIENCIKCHGKNIQQGGLDLTTRNSLLVGGNSGPAIVPQSPQDSLLLQKTTSGAMPLGEKKLSSKKIELIQWLSTLNDESIIEKIVKLRDSEKSDWWKELSKKEKQSIEQGIKDADAGKLNPHSEAKKRYEKWL